MERFLFPIPVGLPLFVSTCREEMAGVIPAPHPLGGAGCTGLLLADQLRGSILRPVEWPVFPDRATTVSVSTFSPGFASSTELCP